MRWIITAALLLFTGSLSASETVDDYGKAYKAAQAERKYLLVTLDYFYPVKADDRHVLCRIFGSKGLSEHAALKDLQGAGVFIVDLTGGKHNSYVVSLLPLKHCSESKVKELLRLPEGSLTQRTLIWAVRTHPERPHSTECEPGAELMAHAERHSKAQADSNRQYHNLPYPTATSEIVAESWEWNKNVVDAAMDLVKSWRGSPGHWNECKRRHGAFGYDMKSNGRKWFGTGCFVN